jgi:hypothetical protein
MEEGEFCKSPAPKEYGDQLVVDVSYAIIPKTEQ